MGLDMYLDKELYMSEFSPTLKDKIDPICRLLHVKDKTGNYKHISVRVPAIYWRKCNQIHAWFVEHAQNGNDDCHDHYVDIDDLIQLKNTIKEQLANRDKIILAPKATDIDEFYWSDLEITLTELNREIRFYNVQNKLGRHWNFVYRSSW